MASSVAATGTAGRPPRAGGAPGRWWLLAGGAAVAAAFLALDIASAALALAVFGARGPAILGAAFNLAAAARFAVTLLPGREPLITRFGRFEAAGLPDADGAYTRRLTWIWAGQLGGFAAAFAAAAVLAWPLAWLPLAELVLCGGLFLSEHALRNRLFPHHGRATPARTLRAIRLAYGAPPSGHAPGHGAPPSGHAQGHRGPQGGFGQVPRAHPGA